MNHGSLHSFRRKAASTQSTSHLFCYQLHSVHTKPPTSTLSPQQFGEKGSPLLNLSMMKRSACTHKDDTSPDTHTHEHKLKILEWKDTISHKSKFNWSRDTKKGCQTTSVIHEILGKNSLSVVRFLVGFCLFSRVLKDGERKVSGTSCSKYLTLLIWYFQDSLKF